MTALKWVFCACRLTNGQVITCSLSKETWTRWHLVEEGKSDVQVLAVAFELVRFVVCIHVTVFNCIPRSPCPEEVFLFRLFYSNLSQHTAAYKCLF